MKKNISLFLLTICSLTLTAQNFFSLKGNGNVVTEERTLQGNFNSIHASNGIDVYLTPGNEIKISVEADSNLHEAIVTEIKNSTLIISTNKNIGRSTRKRVYVTYISLDNLRVESGADIETQAVLKSKELNLISNSGGELQLEVLSESITASAASGGEIELKGKSINLEVKATSGADIEAEKLQVLHANAKASSGASIEIQAQESLKAKAESGGSIKYYGNPEQKETHASISGSIKNKK